jgi:hypothetical protein
MSWRAATIATALSCAFAGAETAAAQEPPPAQECYTVAQTREQIARHGLVEPSGVLREHVDPKKSKPLAARLCRNGEVFIYDITVLHHDGRIESVPINAANGKPHRAHEAPAKGEPPKGER